VIRQKKRRNGADMLFGNSKDVSLKSHEKWFTTMLILLVFGFIFFAENIPLLNKNIVDNIFLDEGITGMAVNPKNGSVYYVDKYNISLQLKDLIRNEIQVLDKDYLSGLSGGKISTNLGITNYEQKFKFSNIENDQEMLSNQMFVDYTEFNNSIGDYLYVKESNSFLKGNFIEYEISFLNGLKSVVEDKYLKDLLGKRLNITANVYEIFNAFRENSGNVILGLINHKVQDVLFENQTKTYVIGGVDYTLQVIDIDDSAKPIVTINVTSAAITNFKGSGTTGDHHFLTDGTLIAFGETTVNRTITGGHVDGIGEEALFDGPTGSCITSYYYKDYVYVADTENHVIRRIDLESGNVTTVAGQVGQAGFADGIGTDAKFNSPSDIYQFNSVFYVADTGNNRIRMITLDALEEVHNVTTIAGGAEYGCVAGTGTDARFRAPKGIYGGWYKNWLGSLALFVADEENHVIWRMLYNGSISPTPKGSDFWIVEKFGGKCDSSGGYSGYVDGVGEDARFNSPQDVTFDVGGGKSNPIYVADANNNVIRIVNNDTKVMTFAGNGTAGWLDGNLNESMFNYPTGLDYFDGAVNNDYIYIADKDNNVLRSILLSDKVVSTIAGNGERGSLNGDVLSAEFNSPTDIIYDWNGKHYVVDNGNHKIRGINSSTGKVFSVAGGGVNLGDKAEIYLGGSFIELEDDNISDNYYYEGVMINGVNVDEAYVRIKGNDSNLSSVVLDSVSYRLGVDPIFGAFEGIWVGVNETVSQWLKIKEALLGTFDIFYDGLTNSDTTLIELKPNTENNAYNLAFENIEEDVYDFSLLNFDNGFFKYGDNKSSIVFREGIINESAGSVAANQNFTIGIGDSFVLSNLDEYHSNWDSAVTKIFRYDSIDVVNKVLMFTNLKDDTTVTVVYSDSDINGTLGAGSFGGEGLNAKIYVAKLNDVNKNETTPLTIDQNVDGVFNGYDVYVVTQGGAILDLGGGYYSVAGNWIAVDDYSGNWDHTPREIDVNGMTVNFITPYGAFGYSTKEQMRYANCTFVEDFGCGDFEITETTVIVNITNNFEYLSKPVTMDVQECDASENNNEEGFNVGESRVFEFENCAAQFNIGLMVDKDLTIFDSDDDYDGTLNSVVESSSHIPESCLSQWILFSVVKSGNELKIEDIGGTCSFDLLQNKTGDYNYSLSNYGAFVELYGFDVGNNLVINYPLKQIKGMLSFVTGSGNEPPPQPPECTSNSDCVGEEVCYNNYCCGLNCDGKECGSDSCGGTCLPGCDANETCDSGQCIVDGGPECTSNSDCIGEEVCYNDNCCDPNCDGKECGSDSCGGTCGTCSGGQSCANNGTCVDQGSGGNEYYFDLDVRNNDDEFDLELYDIVVIEGLSDDYELELINVYSTGKIKFKVHFDSKYWKFSIVKVGDIVNIDLDNDNTIDLNIQSLDVDTVDEEAEVRFKTGKHDDGLNNNGGNNKGGNNKGYCGNGICEIGESKFNCASDCRTVTTIVSTGDTNVPSSTTYDTGGGYSGTTIVRQGTPNTLLWVLLGMLIAAVLVLILFAAMKDKGYKNYFVKEKPKNKQFKTKKLDNQW
jgi:hypothetical protein